MRFAGPKFKPMCASCGLSRRAFWNLGVPDSAVRIVAAPMILILLIGSHLRSLNFSYLVVHRRSADRCATQTKGPATAPPPTQKYAGRAHLSNPGWHYADAVERRTIDQLRAHDGIDQYVLVRIDGAVDLERLEEQ